MVAPRRQIKGKLTVGEVFGNAHSFECGPRLKLDEHIARSVAHAMEHGTYVQAGCSNEEDVLRAKLREAYYLLSILLKSVRPNDKDNTGLDVRRIGSDDWEIPSFRVLICDWLEVTNPWAPGEPRGETADALPESA